MGLLMWASQVTPQQVSSNMAAWLTWIGMEEVPIWLKRRDVDNWVFGIAGLLLVCYLGFLCWKAWGSRPDGSKPNASDDTENTQFHNKRNGSLKIEFSNDQNFKSIGEEEGHGPRLGRLHSYRIAVRNTTSKDIDDAQVWLENITPMPSEFNGHGGLPLHVTHEAEWISSVTLRPSENRRIDVVSFFDRFWNHRILIEHTASSISKEIHEGDEGYEIELVAKGRKVAPFHRKFKIGVKDKDLYMMSLDQSEEEAMEEEYRS